MSEALLSLFLPLHWLCTFRIVVLRSTLSDITADTAFTVTILRKETVTMYCDSQHLREKLLAEFAECIDRATLRTLLLSVLTLPIAF